MRRSIFSALALVLTCLSLLLISSDLVAQTRLANTIATDRPWQIESYADSAGVANHRAYGVAFEANGDVWIAATNGLLHYDGYRWTTFRSEHGLPSTNVRAVLKSKKGELWVGTDNGAGVFDPATRKFDRRGSDKHLPNQNLRRIEEDPDGTIWFCCDQWPDPSIPPGGLACLKDGDWRTFNHQSGIPMDYVLNYFRASNGRQFACTRQGWVERRDEDTWGTPSEPGSNAQDIILRMAETPDGALWAQGGSRLLRLKDGSWKPISQPTATITTLRDGRLAAIIRDSTTGKLCFSIWNGNTFVPASAWIVNPFNARIYNLKEAPDGALWAVGAGMILRWSPLNQPWLVYPNISHIHGINKDNRVWLISGGVLHTMEGDNLRAISEHKALVGMDYDGTAIIRMLRGNKLAAYKPDESGKPIPLEEGVAKLQGTCNEHNGRLWLIGTDESGSLVFAHRTESKWTELKSELLTGRSLGSACPAIGGGLWVLAIVNQTMDYDIYHVSIDGIRRGDLGAKKTYCVSRNYTQTANYDWIHGLDAVFQKERIPGSPWKKIVISDNSVRAVEGSQSSSNSDLGHPPLEVGRLIALPEQVFFTFAGGKGGQSGCVILHKDHWEVRNGKFTGLYPSNDNETVFLGTLGGVFVGKRSDNYGLQFIPLPEEVHQNNIIGQDGRSFWATTSNGVFRYNPTAQPPSVEVNIPVSEIQEGGTIPVRFSGIRRFATRTSPAAFSYSWRFDQGPWSPYSSEYDIRLPVEGLQPGEHNIEVRCQEHGGLDAASNAHVTFRVLPLPLQHRVWFIPAILVVFVLLLYLAWVGIARTRQISKANSALRKEIRERMKADDALRIANDNLEQRVYQRTAELSRANEALRCEIAERKRAVEHQYELETQLREARKLEALGTLAGGIAHDFNNILTVIIPSTHLALEECQSNPSARDLLEQILRSANHARDLVQQILAFSRQQKMQLHPIEIPPIISDAARSASATLPPSLQLTWQVEPNLPYVKGDSTQLQRLLLNLCTNARQAMTGRTGVIEIKAERVRPTPELIRQCPGLKSCDYVRLSVRDEGIGMSEEVRQRAFDPFFTTKNPGEGTGLGLSVVHGIVKEHGGAVQIDTEIGKGTFFKVYLPACEAVPAAPRHPPVANKNPGASEEILVSGEGRSLLLVDDDAIVSKVVERVLRRAKYRVTCFSDPQKALAAFKDNPGAFDAVITDFAMPGINGVELSRQISSIRDDIPIILITGYAGSCTPEQIATSGIRKVVGKPFDPAAFSVILGELLPPA